ncbi:MAG TPA: hypothetical protein PKD45_09380 [Flavobacteriales bacterium]|nr:hypothetical protein [Flavobacteriales bacterium]
MLTWGQTYVPPDLYGDEHKGGAILRQNKGQVFDTESNQRNDVKAYFEGSPLGSICVTHPAYPSPTT